MLTRWAHFALTSDAVDRIGSSGTFDYGRIEYEIENAMKRFERLSQQDGYSAVRDGTVKRPTTSDYEEEEMTPLQEAQKKEDFVHDRT
jgi:hypothetical protein